MVEDGFGEGIPQVVTGGEFVEGAELAARRFVGMGDFAEGFDFGDEDVGPSDFNGASHAVTADVCGAPKDGTGFFFGFSDSGGL